MHPSSPPGTGRDPWADDDAGPSATAPTPRSGPTDAEPPAKRSRPRRFRKSGEAARRPDDEPDPTDDEVDDEPPVEISRQLSLTVAGFAALLGIGLVLGAQTAGPGHRLPFAIILFGVQLLFILAWTMAVRPPALLVVAVVSAGSAVVANVVAVRSAEPGLAPLGYVVVAGFVVAVAGQLVRRTDRARVTDSLGVTLLTVLGVVAFAGLLVLSRIPAGTQAVTVCLTAAGVALAVARSTDAVLVWPRLAPQVPRAAAGVVVGAMVGTLASAVFGSFLVAPFTPSRAALIGLLAAVTAVLADLALGYAEVGRVMAGEPPTMWIARHLQGPLGGFAMAAAAAYPMCRLLL
ncbi:hypothetical protein ABT336_02080 [Micromonospora sp. NPDC000207]|uniref:hypothetical protein n=1 Tax=Micromonospora sp. NPDC000207 TaxID=3154246 RepID=UPI00332A2A9E